MTYARVKGILFYTFLFAYIIFCFLFYYNVDIIGDAWILQWDIKTIYSLRPGYHSGRNFGEYISLFPRVFGGQLLFFIPEPLIRVKFATALIDTLLMFSLWSVSALFTTRVHRRLSFILFALLSMLNIVLGLKNTVVNSIALLGMSYIAWIPMFFYLRDNKLPQWMIRNPYKFMGIWLVLVYCGTQVYDYSYFMIAPMSLLFFMYSFIQKKTQGIIQAVADPISFYTANAVNLSFLFLSSFSLFRNVVISGRGRASVYSPSLDIIELFHRFKANPSIIVFGVLFGLFLLLFCCISFIVKKKIRGEDYFIASLCCGSLSAVALVTIIDARNHYTMWSFCIAFGIIILRLWDTKKWMQIVFPTFLFFLLTEVGVRQYYVYLNSFKIFDINTRTDAKHIELFKQAQREGWKEIILSECAAAADYGIYGADDYTLGSRSYFMYFLGYTDRNIPIIITNDLQNAP